MAGRAALQKSIQELRILLDQTSTASQGARDFVFGTYQALKKANPRTPILVRECSGVQAALVARYDLGVEERVLIEGKSVEAIGKDLDALIKKGESMPRCGGKS